MDKDQRNKRSKPEDSLHLCGQCETELNTHTNHIQCDICGLNYCQRCSRISDMAYQCLINSDIDNMTWSCRVCKRTKPTLDHINNSLKMLCEKNEVRLDSIESRLNQLETTSKETKTELHKASTMMDNLRENVFDLVDERTKELQERRSKEENVILFNMPECENQTPDEIKTHDTQVFNQLCTALTGSIPETLSMYRLGKHNKDKSRPLVAVMKAKQERKQLLEKARNIKDRAPPSLKNAILTRDLTKLQREERKAKFKARKTVENLKESSSSSSSSGTKINKKSKEKDLLSGDSPATGPIRNPSHQNPSTIQKSTTVDDVRSLQSVDFISPIRPSQRSAKLRMVTASVYNDTTLNSSQISIMDDQEETLAYAIDSDDDPVNDTITESGSQKTIL